MCEFWGLQSDEIEDSSFIACDAASLGQVAHDVSKERVAFVLQVSRSMKQRQSGLAQT